MLMMCEPGRIRTLCNHVCAHTDHGVTLSYRTRADEAQKNHNNGIVLRYSIRLYTFELCWCFKRLLLEC